MYEGNARLKEELAAVRASALREEVARLRLELYTAQASAAGKLKVPSMFRSSLSALTLGVA